MCALPHAPPFPSCTCLTAAAPAFPRRRALELLSRYVGALPAASLLAAHCLLLSGQTDAAQRKAADILRANPEDSAAHLLARLALTPAQRAPPLAPPLLPTPARACALPPAAAAARRCGGRRPMLPTALLLRLRLL